MAAEAISFEELKRLVVARLRKWLDSLPEAERDMPRVVVMGRAYSPRDLLSEVERETDVGLEYMGVQAKTLGYVVG